MAGSIRAIPSIRRCSAGIAADILLESSRPAGGRPTRDALRRACRAAYPACRPITREGKFGMAESATTPAARPLSILRGFLESEAAGGLILMAAAALALVVANSPLGPAYFAALGRYLGPLSVLHWINDGLMAVFFLLVGLEIKREMLDGQLSTWPRRLLPGLAALGGMGVPALIYVGINAGTTETLRGWAIPAATDIAFALGVLAILGSRIPPSLKIFLTALAILDDLGAVVIIAVFYTSDLSIPMLAGAGVCLAALVALNWAGAKFL